ncbi:hypothetical protein D3C71_1712750 [compost metagenome]
MLLLVEHQGHFEQCPGLAAIQPQRALEIGLRLVALVELESRQTEVLEHPGTLGVHIVHGRLLIMLQRFLVAPLLEQETTIVIQQAGIATALR